MQLEPVSHEATVPELEQSDLDPMRRHTHPGYTLIPEKDTPLLDVRPINPTPLKAITDDTYRPEGSTVLDAASSFDKEVKPDATQLDVTGQPREKSIPKPTVLLGGRPGEEPNIQVDYEYYN